MMNPCRSNLLPILITLLSCAGLFIFFNLRLNELKMTVEKQNRVLTSFITNVQQDIKAGGTEPTAVEPTKHFAAPEALIAARKQEIDKIIVSDDEDDSDSESESDSDCESDGEEDIKVVQITPSMSFEPVTFDQGSFQPVSFEVLSFVNMNNESSVASESSITEIIEEPLEPLEPLNIVNLIGKTEETNKSEATSYDQMKVDDLRKIVTDKNLCTKEEGKKLKKPELLLLLKK